MNTKLRTEAKNTLFELINNAAFGNTMENVRIHRDVQLVTTNKRKIYLVSKPNYHTKIWLSENLLAIEMKELKIKMNKAVYLDLSILEISKTLLY